MPVRWEWSGRRDSNPSSSVWKTDTLTFVLRPHVTVSPACHAYGVAFPDDAYTVTLLGMAQAKARQMVCQGMESNHLRALLHSTALPMSYLGIWSRRLGSLAQVSDRYPESRVTPWSSTPRADMKWLRECGSNAPTAQLMRLTWSPDLRRIMVARAGVDPAKLGL